MDLSGGGYPGTGRKRKWRTSGGPPQPTDTKVDSQKSGQSGTRPFTIACGMLVTHASLLLQVLKVGRFFPNYTRNIRNFISVNRLAFDSLQPLLKDYQCQEK